MANLSAESGLFIGVDDSTDPTDDTPNTLTAAVNMYLPDPANGCAAYSRPGALRPNVIPTSTGEQQGGWCHVGGDGTVYNFIFTNGKVFRQPTTLTSAPTDVTPTNVRISTGTGITPGFQYSRMVFCASLNDQLIVNDGVNKPWIGTNLSATPITATTIDFRSAVVNLSRGTVSDKKVANAAFIYSTVTSGVVTAATLAAAETSLPAGTIPTDKWGVFLFEVDSAGAVQISAGAANFTTGYNSEAIAIAALPAKTLNTRWFGGYFTIKTHSGTTFVDGTDGLFGGASGNVASATNYYAGDSPPWQAFGWPRIGTGSLHFVLRTDGLTNVPLAIAWSEPNQPNVGYLQTNYNNTFTLSQTGSTPIYCIWPSNSGLYYSRDLSWGCLRGPPYLYSNNTTQDTISTNVGCVAPATVHGFGNYVYFSDTSGRTHRFALGTTSGTEPLWLQARTGYDTATNAGQTAEAAVQNYTWAIIEPNLNIYLVAAYPTTSGNFAPNTLYVFDAKTGRYCGTWTVGGQVGLNIGFILRDANNQPALIMLQAPDGSANGYIWQLTRAAANVWQDNSTTVPVSLNGPRMAYSAKSGAVVDTVRVLTNNATPVACTVLNSTASTSFGTQTPPGTPPDGVYRAVFGSPGSVNGRGAILSVSPTTTTSQWQCYRLQMDYAPVPVVNAGEP